MNRTGNDQAISANSVPAQGALGKGLETFIHTFPATPVSPAYERLAVRHGFNAKPVFIFEGRQCYVLSDFRVAGRVGRYGHSRLTIKFLDNEEITTVAVGEFAKKAKNP